MALGVAFINGGLVGESAMGQALIRCRIMGLGLHEWNRAGE